MKILIVSAHPDDIEFNMGATLAQLSDCELDIHIYTLSDSKTYNGKFDLREEMKKSMSILGLQNISIDRFDTNRFKEHVGEIKDSLFVYKNIKPDIVFCTSPNSLHDDHQVVGSACESIFTESTIYAMDDIRGNQKQIVNCWNPVTDIDLILKWKMLQQYESQKHRPYNNQRLLEARAIDRGMQISNKYAEAFEVIRKVGKIIS